MGGARASASSTLRATHSWPCDRRLKRSRMVASAVYDADVLDTRQYRTDQPNGDRRAEINEDALNPANTLLAQLADRGAAGDRVTTGDHQCDLRVVEQVLLDEVRVTAAEGRRSESSESETWQSTAPSSRPVWNKNRERPPTEC